MGTEEEGSSQRHGNWGRRGLVKGWELGEKEAHK